MLRRHPMVKSPEFKRNDHTGEGGERDRERKLRIPPSLSPLDGCNLPDRVRSN